MKKKILSLFLCVAMLCAMLPMMAVSASAEAPEGWDYATADTTATADWYDAEATTLEINSAADLLAFAAKVQETAGRVSSASGPFNGKTIVLNKNIDLNPNWSYDTSTGTLSGVDIVWPVNKQVSFHGMFDGQGHTIRGISITATAQDVGMFGMAGGGTEAAPAGIKNVTIDNYYSVNSRTDTQARFGVLFGSVNAEHLGNSYVIIDNVNVGQSVYIVKDAVGQSIGGFIGKVMWPSSNSLTVKISNSSFAGEVISLGADVAGGNSASHVGGFVGTAVGAVELQNCVFKGKIKGIQGQNSPTTIGGMIGSAELFNTPYQSATITGCVSSGIIDLSGVTVTNGTTRWCMVGGMVGRVTSGKTLEITNSAMVGSITGLAHSEIGGFVGNIAGTVNADKVLFSGTTRHTQNRGGAFAGQIDSTAVITLQNSALVGTVQPGGYTWEWAGALTGYSASANVTLTNVIYSDTYSNVVGAGYVLEDTTDLSSVYGEDYEYFQHHLLPFGNYYKNSNNQYLPSSTKQSGAPAYPTLNTVKYIPYADRFDMDPAGALVAAMGEAGLTSANGWTLTTTNGPIPTAVLDKIDLVNTPANAKTQFKGFQGTQIADGKYNVRLIGLVDGLDPKEVGFRVIVRYNDGIEANVTTTSSVYTSVIGGAKTYTVAELGGDADDYIFALNVNGIPESKGVVTVEVTTFHVKDDVTTIGQTQVFTVDPANDLPKAGV